MSLQQHHVEATAVTLDYPSVSDFERDFLGLSSHSQWSSMLHRTRHHRSRFESRYQAYQPLLSPPRAILFCPHRFVAPATRGLRRCDRPFPESSSIIELDTEPHREASAALSTTFSHIPRHCRFLCIFSRYFMLAAFLFILDFTGLVSKFLQNHMYVFSLILFLILYLFFFLITPLLFLFFLSLLNFCIVLSLMFHISKFFYYGLDALEILVAIFRINCS